MSLEAFGLACFRADRLVLRDLSFALAPGRALLLTGPNGAGKSTLLRLLAGLKRPDAGQIAWNGIDINEDRQAHAARLAFIGEQNAIKPGLTAAENLAFAASRSETPQTEALAAMGLADLADIPARMLSAGQRRRLALARLALAPGKLWLLDEPTLGLDTASVARLGALMQRHLEANGLIVAATHLPLPVDAETLAL
jgi:heme exporter protein A